MQHYEHFSAHSCFALLALTKAVKLGVCIEEAYSVRYFHSHVTLYRELKNKI
jgi:hypothetical protein